LTEQVIEEYKKSPRQIVYADKKGTSFTITEDTIIDDYIEGNIQRARA